MIFCEFNNFFYVGTKLCVNQDKSGMTLLTRNFHNAQAPKMMLKYKTYYIFKAL